MNNLKHLGYGAKAFTISMVETALLISGQKISGTDIRHIIDLGNSLKSDIQLVLSLGGYGMHIPFEVMWKHEVVDTFTHAHLKRVKRFDELLLLFE